MIQHLELHLMIYAKVWGGVTEAAKIGIITLAEEEFICRVAELKSVESFIDYKKLTCIQIPSNAAN